MVFSTLIQYWKIVNRFTRDFRDCCLSEDRLAERQNEVKFDALSAVKS